MFDKHTQLWSLGIWRLPVHNDDTILVDEPRDDQLHQVCLLEKLRLRLDFF